MRNNKRRFEKILAAGLALGSLRGSLAGAANLKKPVSQGSSNKSVVDKIWSNKITKGAALAILATVGGKTLFDIGNGIYNKFRNKDIKNTEPGFVDFENKKISELKGSNIIVHDGKILMSLDVEQVLDLTKDDFIEKFSMVKVAGMHDGTRQQFLAAEDEIYKWRKEHKNDRKVVTFEYKNDANFEKGLEERTIHYLLDSKDGVDADNNNKIGLSTNTVFRIKGEKFRFKINVSDIANLETQVLAKKMLSKYLGQGLELEGNNIEIIPDDSKESSSEEKINEYKAIVIENFAKPQEGKQRLTMFLRIPGENLVIVNKSQVVDKKLEVEEEG